MALFLYLIIKNSEEIYVIPLIVGITAGVMIHAFVRAFLLIKY